ncbi:unnamed protein product [Discula destructiva]
MTTGDGEGSSRGRSSPTRPSHQHLPPLQTSAQPHPQHGALLAAPLPPPPLSSQPQSPPLLLTVRFSTDLPDLQLDIPHPAGTTIAALKHLIRSRLAQPTSQRRLRFIHSGKILQDSAIVAAVLKPLPPPPRDAQHQQHTSDPKGKGKGKGRAVEDSNDDAAAAQRVYVICSIGDLLTDAELDDEKRRAEEPVPETVQSSAASPLLPGGVGTGSTTTTRGPRGFDRLLTAGIPSAEVNQLRLSFRALHESRHTADALPSPDTMRNLEDAWLDNNHGAAVTAAGGSINDEGSAAAGIGDDSGLAGHIDLIVKGMFIGFVWPLGALGWLVRDEEKIPKRMRVFVYFGFFLSLLIGMVRVIG